jgi:hypothetical protein
MRLWRTLGAPRDVQLAVRALDLDTPLSEYAPGRVFFAWAGGAPAAGAHHRGFLLAVVPAAEHTRYESPEAYFAAHPPQIDVQERVFTIDRWMRSTSVAIHTQGQGLVRISRRSVLKYIANAKGGVHFDPTRRLDVRSGKKNRQAAERHLLDHGLLRVGHLSGPEYEVASMAHATATSDWAADFISVANDVALKTFRATRES